MTAQEIDTLFINGEIMTYFNDLSNISITDPEYNEVEFDEKYHSDYNNVVSIDEDDEFIDILYSNDNLLTISTEDEK
jgi:hypothetical protein